MQHGLSAFGQLTRPHSNPYTGQQVMEGPSGGRGCVGRAGGSSALGLRQTLLTTLKERKFSFGGFSFSYYTQCVGFGDEDGNKGPNLKDALGQRFSKCGPGPAALASLRT